ncbi:MAG: DUF5688 family protein [Lachnospiraceae bacterium]|nr:DUF5688 family protein [Lachnospiraceae bacterium]
MELSTFMQHLTRTIEANNAGLHVVPTETQKTNGIKMAGLTLQADGETVAPVFYVNELFRRYEEGEETIEGIAKHILSQYEALPAPNIPDMHNFLSSPNFLDRIRLRLMNQAKNWSMIANKNLVYHEVLGTDLICTFHADVMSDIGSTGTIAINEEILKKYLPQFENGDDLYDEIIKRTTEEQVQLESMLEVMKRLLQERLGDILPDELEDNHMYVLTNKDMTYGASVVLTEAARKAILEIFPEGECLLLPSSLHETILLKTSAGENLETLREMVQTVNATEVSESDFLSNNVYRLNILSGELEIAE